MNRFSALASRILISLAMLLGASVQQISAQGRPLPGDSASPTAPGKPPRTNLGIILPSDPAGAYILSPANNATVYVNQAVSFSGSTDYGTSFTWTFGDGATATGLTATHTYTTTGTFTVSFKATATGYFNSTTSITLTVAPPPNTAPVISSFTASPSSIAAGGSSTLSWSTSYATSLSITNIGTVTGTSVVVKPMATTTYRLTATNSVGSVYKDVTVTIVPPPTIASFSASPATIGLGQTSTLSWSTTNATTLSISGIGAVTGTSLAVKPAVTTAYTLTAKNVAGTATKTLTVTVVQPPVISSFTASPQIIKAGQSSTLSWSVTGATSLSISGIGTVTGTSLVVTPTVTTTYTLTATNLAGGVTAVITVKVPPKLTWKGDRIYGFGKLLSEDKPGATAGTVQSTYVQTDQVESVSIVTDATGVVLTRMKNLPSGERYAQSGTTVAFERYAAHEDAQGYSIYMKARTYLPMYGRFAQSDPAYYGPNLYTYAEHDPITRFDPNGLEDVLGTLASVGETFDTTQQRQFKNEKGEFYLVPISTQVGDDIYTNLSDKEHSRVGHVSEDCEAIPATSVMVSETLTEGQTVVEDLSKGDLSEIRATTTDGSVTTVRTATQGHGGDANITGATFWAGKKYEVEKRITTLFGLLTFTGNAKTSPAEVETNAGANGIGITGNAAARGPNGSIGGKITLNLFGGFDLVTVDAGATTGSQIGINAGYTRDKGLGAGFKAALGGGVSFNFGLLNFYKKSGGKSTEKIERRSP